MIKKLIYCDESSQNKHRYMVLGGVCCDDANYADIDNTFKKFRFEYNMHSELKWTKVSRGKLEEYKFLMDQFFALNNNGLLDFHCLVLDSKLIDHARFNNNDKELGFYKFYYQLFLHGFGRRYGRERIFHAHLDQRQTGYALNDLRKVLNKGCSFRYRLDHNPFRLVEYRNSKDENLIQIADILIGSIGARKNKHQLLPNASKAKAELASYIRESAGLTEDISTTKMTENSFSVWNFRLS